MKRWILLSSVLAVALFVVYRNSRVGLETASYEVVQSDGRFEIRVYDSMEVVSTPMSSSDASEDPSFMRLFRYISGANEREQEISMTTPVLTRTEAPDRRMSFVVPRDVARSGAPDPSSEEVELSTLEGGPFASFRFSGDWSPSRVERAERELLDWVGRQGLTPAGEPLAAFYDPPFTPSFLKRNEVLVRLASR